MKCVGMSLVEGGNEGSGGRVVEWEDMGSKEAVEVRRKKGKKRGV